MADSVLRAVSATAILSGGFQKSYGFFGIDKTTATRSAIPIAGNDPHAEGQALFQRNCAICHGVQGSKAPANISDEFEGESFVY